jgi:hypothetical protein
MLAVFSLRLAAGMLAALLLLSPSQVNPRFYRTHFLAALGFTVLAVLFRDEAAGWPLLALLLGGAVLAFLGSAAWSLEGAPGGRALIILTPTALAAALVWQEAAGAAGSTLAVALLGDALAAAVLGSALTAMLIGHSYLIAPAMSLTPLLRLLAFVAVAVLLRMGVDTYLLWCWTRTRSLGNLANDAVLLVFVRWAVGFLGVLALDWMAWQSARIRSTQSATGILYVVVIFCFLGELTGQLLRGAGLAL